MPQKVHVSRPVIVEGETPLGAAALGPSLLLAGVNDQCHTWEGHLNGDGSWVMYNPRVVGIYWDSFFRAAAGNVTTFEGFFNDVFHSEWMTGLAQYHINPATYLGSFTPTDTVPAKMDDSQVRDLLVRWLDAGTVTPIPADRELNTLYVIFTPAGMEVTLNGLSSKTDFSGYHNWGRYRKSPIFTTENLFYAVIPMFSVAAGTSAANVVASLARVLSHEMAEAFSDRNGSGYKAPNGCEIGDICERKSSVIISPSWRIEKYWSDRDQRCFPLGDFGFGRGDRAFQGRFVPGRIAQELLIYSSADDQWRLGSFATGNLVAKDIGNTVGFGHAINDGRPFWVGDFNGSGSTNILMYYPGDDNWWLGQVNAINQLNWNLAGNSAGFGHAINDGRPFWIGDFNGNGSIDILMYYPGDDNWWFGQFNANNQLTWSLAGNTAGFGHAINDGRPFWIGDFNGDGRADLLMYFPGDGNWWLGKMINNQLQWSFVGNTKGAPQPQPPLPAQCQALAAQLSGIQAQIADLQAQLPDTPPAGRARIAAQIRLLQAQAAKIKSSLDICIAQNSPPPPAPWPNFGQVWDGRPFWIGDFNGNGSTDVLMYYPGDDNSWLGQIDANNRLNWTLAGNSAGFGHAINDGRPFWIGDFNGNGSVDILMYYPGDDNWWFGQVNANNQLTWSLAGNTSGFGHAINDGRPFWVGDFTGSGSTDILMFRPADGNWWLGQIDGSGKLNWKLVGSTPD